MEERARYHGPQRMPPERRSCMTTKSRLDVMREISNCCTRTIREQNPSMPHLYHFPTGNPDEQEIRMKAHKVVSKDEWLAARRDHLAKEKEFTRLRDQLSQDRRELPWVKVEKRYLFDGPKGKETLLDLFEGRS